MLGDPLYGVGILDSLSSLALLFECYEMLENGFKGFYFEILVIEFDLLDFLWFLIQFTDDSFIEISRNSFTLYFGFLFF